MGYDAGQDKLKDECGVFGIWSLGQSEEAANFTYLGLHALQHRGQESAGIVSTDGETLHVHRDMGLVADIFDAETLRTLKGGAAIGHVRYSTAGASHVKNAQPFAVQYAGGPVAVAHNGNLVNAEALRAELEGQGSIFTSSSDTEVVVHLIARARPAGAPGSTEQMISAVRQAMARVSGAYSILFLTPRAIIGARDPMGFRPLVVGRLKGSFILASETTALDLLEAEYVREVEPGELVVIDGAGLRSERLFPDQRPSARLGRCVFEHIYFARPDSVLFGKSVYAVRHGFGKRFHEKEARVFGHGSDFFLDGAVIYRVLEPVAPARTGKVRGEGQIDQHVLFFPTLVVVDPDDTPYEKIANQDSVHYRPPEGVCRRPRK